MAQFERFNANLEQQRGQPPQPPTADGHSYIRCDRDTTHVYEPYPYMFDDEQPRRGQFDDINLSRSSRTHAQVFTAEITFPDFKRDYINYLRAINSAFTDMLEGASPLDVGVNTTYQSFQKNVWLLLRRDETPYYCYSATKLSAGPVFQSPSVARLRRLAYTH
jgi:hypothetical protein